MKKAVDKDNPWNYTPKELALIKRISDAHLKRVNDMMGKYLKKHPALLKKKAK